MSNVTEFRGITTQPIDSDKVLDAAKGALTDVLVLGWSKDGKFYAASSNADLQAAIYLASKFVHKVHSEYEPT